MKTKYFFKITLIIFGIGFAQMATAQTEPTAKTAGTSGILENNSYTWLESNDPWNYQQDFGYMFDSPGPTLTAKGIDTGETEKFATRGPVLTKYCFGEQDAVQCTKDFIASNFQNRYHPSIIYPAGYSGKEFVVFTLNDKGEVVGDYKVLRQSTSCEPCTQAAVNEVAKLGKFWSPAMRNGFTAQSTVVVPVSFRVTAPPQDDDDDK